MLMFQSTPPRGGRHSALDLHHPTRCFNPRPRAGGDPKAASDLSSARNVSIHAPARGATCAFWASICASAVFQSTPPRGGRRCLRRPLENAVSIHAPARGATAACELITLVGFQSTPPRGGRLSALRCLPTKALSEDVPRMSRFVSHSYSVFKDLIS